MAVETTNLKERRTLQMKKIVALGVALLVLLFSFIPTAEVAENKGICVCEDLKPSGNTQN